MSDKRADFAEGEQQKLRHGTVLENVNTLEARTCVEDKSDSNDCIPASVNVGEDHAIWLWDKVLTSQFFESVWEQRSAVWRKSELPGTPFTDSYLSPECLAGVIMRVWLRGHLALVKRGLPASGLLPRPPDDVDTYEGAEKRSEFAQDVPHSINLPIFTSLLLPYLEGCSYIMNQADRSLPQLQGLCQRLASRGFSHVFAVLYLTPPHSFAVRAHSDSQDVFLLQLWGTKSWDLFSAGRFLCYDDEMLGKSKPIDFDLGTPQKSFDLSEGDILYIPRGVVHCGHAKSTRPSLHVTITIPTAEMSHATMVERAFRYLLRERRLTAACERRCRSAMLMIDDLPGRYERSQWMDETFREVSRNMTHELIRDANRAHFAEIGRAQWSQFLSAHRYPINFPITCESPLQLESGISCECSEGGKEAVFRRKQQWLRLSICPSASLMIVRIAEGRPIKLLDLPCLDAFERLAVAVVLLNKGLIAVSPGTRPS